MESRIIFDPVSVVERKIEPGAIQATDLNRPTESLYREFGEEPLPQKPIAETYTDLIHEHKN